MMEMTIKLIGTEGLETAINNLAAAITGGKIDAVHIQPQVQAQTNPVQEPVTVYQQQAMQAPVAPPIAQPLMGQAVQPGAGYQIPVQQMPVQSTQAPPMQVPTTAVPQTYTQDQLAVAMTGLMDQGKQQMLMSILQGFGASSLMEIPKERYPEVVIRLREAGANI